MLIELQLYNYGIPWCDIPYSTRLHMSNLLRAVKLHIYGVLMVPWDYYYNSCMLKFHVSRRFKMKANTVMFSVSMPKVYKRLPSPWEEMEEIIAFIFISPTRPTNEMHKRLPSFVRRNKVHRVLEWLELNHEDYSDLEISYKNVKQYPESASQ